MLRQGRKRTSGERTRPKGKLPKGSESGGGSEPYLDEEEGGAPAAGVGGIADEEEEGGDEEEEEEEEGDAPAAGVGGIADEEEEGGDEEEEEEEEGDAPAAGGGGGGGGGEDEEAGEGDAPAVDAAVAAGGGGGGGEDEEAGEGDAPAAVAAVAAAGGGGGGGGAGEGPAPAVAAPIGNSFGPPTPPAALAARAARPWCNRLGVAALGAARGSAAALRALMEGTRPLCIDDSQMSVFNEDAPPLVSPQDIQRRKDLAILRMKRVLADLVHDFSRPFLDSNFTPQRLVNRIFNSYVELLGGEEAAIKAELIAFFGDCGSDSTAKAAFYAVLAQYNLKYNIPVSVGTTFIDMDDTAGQDYRAFMEELKIMERELGITGVHYVDSQAINIPEGFEAYKTLQGGDQKKSKVANDLAIRADPGSGLSARLLVEYPNCLDGAIRLSKKHTGLGHDLLIYTDHNRILTTWWNRPESVPRRVEPAASISKVKNNIELMGQNENQLDELFRKPGGDTGQVIMHGSEAWDIPTIRSIHHTLDLLEHKDGEIVRKRDYIITNPIGEARLYKVTQGVTQLSVADSNTARSNWTNREAFCAAPAESVSDYFVAIDALASRGNYPRFTRKNIGEDATVPIYTHAGKAYFVESITPGNQIDRAFAAGLFLFLDVTEKLYIQTLVAGKIRVLKAIDQPAGVVPPVEVALEAKYSPYVNAVQLNDFLNLHEFFLAKANFTKISSLFKDKDYMIDIKESIYNAILSSFKKYSSVPNLPAKTISLIITSLFAAAGMPRLPERINRPSERITKLVNSKLAREKWLSQILNHPIIKGILTTMLPTYLKSNAAGILTGFTIDSYSDLSILYSALKPFIIVCFRNYRPGEHPLLLPAQMAPLYAQMQQMEVQIDIDLFKISTSVTVDRESRVIVQAPVPPAPAARGRILKSAKNPITPKQQQEVIRGFRQLLTQLSKEENYREITNLFTDLKRSGLPFVARKNIVEKNVRFKKFLKDKRGFGSITRYVQMQTGGGGDGDEPVEALNTNTDEAYDESTITVHTIEAYMDLMDEIDDNLKEGIEWYQFKQLFSKSLLMATVYYENPDLTLVYADAAVHEFYDTSTPEELGPAFAKLLNNPTIKSINSEFIYKYDEFLTFGAEISKAPVPDDVTEYIKTFTDHLDYLVKESDTKEFPFSAAERTLIVEENKQWLDLIRTDDKIFNTLYGDLYTLKRTDPKVQSAISRAMQLINSKPTYGTTASPSIRSVVSSPPLSSSFNLKKSSEVPVSAGGRRNNRRTLSRLGKRRGTRKNRAESQTDTEAALTRSRRTRRRK